MVNNTPRPTNINGPHCQACGSQRPQDIRDLRDTEGYTRCCNERVVNHTDPTALYDNGIRCATSSDCYHD